MTRRKKAEPVPRRWSVTVVRKQVWHVDVEAADEEAAKEAGDAEARDCSPNDDYGYETTAREITR